MSWGGLSLRREPILLLTCILLATIGQGLVLPFLFVYLTRVRHFDPTVAGLVGGWIGLVGLVIAIPVGGLVDRLGSRRVFCGLVTIYAAGVASYAGVHHPWQAFAAAAFTACGGAPLLGAYNTLLASATDEKDRQAFFGLAFATLNLGLGIGGLIGGTLADIRNPRTFELLYALDGAALLAAAAIAVGLPRLGAPAPRSASPRELGGYRAVVANHRFRSFIILGVLLMSSAYAQLEFGFPAFAVGVARVSTQVIGWSFAANSVTILMVQLFVIPRLDGRSRTGVLAIAGLVVGSSWLVLAGGTAARSLGRDLPAVGVFGCAVVFAIAEVLMSPVIPALTNALAEDALRGRYNAMSSMVFGVTTIVGPITAATLIGHGLSTVWVVLVVAGALGSSVLALNLRRSLSDFQDGRIPLRT